MASLNPLLAPARPPSARRWLHACLEAPLRRPLRVLVPTGLAGLVAFGGSLLLPAQYRAAATIRADWKTEVQPRVATELTARRLQAVRQHVLGRATIEWLLGEADPYPPVRGQAVPCRSKWRGWWTP